MNKLHKLGIFLCLLNYSCHSAKELKVFGFVRKENVITVKRNNDTLLHFTGQRIEGADSVCSFNETTTLNTAKDSVVLTITVNSGNIVVLDTSVVIMQSNKRPFVSILPPRDSCVKQSLFLGDEKDSTYHKL